MVSFVAVDFETANPSRASACSVGVVRVDAGEVTDAWSTLIDPETSFHPMNVWIHNIDETAVVGAPRFPEVMDRITATMDGSEVLIAHSAAFDLRVIADSALRYEMQLEPLPFACTRVFSRAWWPNWPSYALKRVVTELKLEDELGGWNHHDALWDAQAAAAIARRGFAHRPAGSWAEAAKALKLRIGMADLSKLRGCVSTAHGTNKKIDPVAPPTDSLDPDHPLHGRSVCFTGTLQLYARREAAQAVADVGGLFSASVNQSTDLLVVGTQDLERLGGKSQSSKMRKAAGMAAEGHRIEIIDEIDFYQLL